MQTLCVCACVWLWAKLTLLLSCLQVTFGLINLLFPPPSAWVREEPGRKGGTSGAAATLRLRDPSLPSRWPGGRVLLGGGREDVVLGLEGPDLGSGRTWFWSGRRCLVWRCPWLPFLSRLGCWTAWPRLKSSPQAAAGWCWWGCDPLGKGCQ